MNLKEILSALCKTNQSLKTEREKVMASFGSYRPQVEAVVGKFAGEAKYTVLLLFEFAQQKNKIGLAIERVNEMIARLQKTNSVTQDDWLKFLRKEDVEALAAIYRELEG
jgi:hypothetical protein